MANPNIAGLTTVKGKSVGVDLNTTAVTNLVANSSNSGEVFKINSLIVSNVDGTNAASITVQLRKNALADFHLAKLISVPPNATLVVVSKDMQLYLEENDTIRIFASAANILQAICSYEEIA